MSTEHLLSETLYTAADLQDNESRVTPNELRELGDLARALEAIIKEKKFPRKEIE